MKRWVRRLAVPVGLVVVIVVLRATVFRPAPVPVSVQAVERGRVEDTVVNTRAGTVESRLRARMSPAVAGLVVAIPAQKGTRVKKGEVLLRLDDSEYRAQVSQAEKALDAAGAAADQACLAADQADRNYTRAQGMAKQSLISDEELESARTTAETTRAACVASRARTKEAGAALASARAVLAKTVMIAPFDGVVLDVTTEVGEWISPSPPGVFIPPVVDVIDPDSLYVSAPLDEADIARVRVGLPCRITMDAFRGRSFAGHISYVASYVESQEAQNRTLTVEAVFDEKDLPPTLLPGISADVEVILDVREGVLRIPTFSLLEGDRVLVVEGNRLVEKKVTPGIRNWQYTEIREGLSEGDRVVTSLDRPEVKAGVRVTVSAAAGS